MALFLPASDCRRAGIAAAISVYPVRRSGATGSRRTRRRSLRAAGPVCSHRRKLIVENRRRYGATRPIAVANSASAIPGATTARRYSSSGDRLEAGHNAQTVPNRRRRGRPSRRWPAPASVVRGARSLGRWLFHHLLDTHLKPAIERWLPSKLRFHSRIAATNSAPSNGSLGDSVR